MVRYFDKHIFKSVAGKPFVKVRNQLIKWIVKSRLLFMYCIVYANENGCLFVCMATTWHLFVCMATTWHLFVCMATTWPYFNSITMKFRCCKLDLSEWYSNIRNVGKCKIVISQGLKGTYRHTYMIHDQSLQSGYIYNESNVLVSSAFFRQSSCNYFWMCATVANAHF